MIEGNRDGIKSQETIDVRGIWNVAERLAHAGNKNDAKILREFLNDPKIRERLEELAKQGGFDGGTRLAEQAMEESLKDTE